jgi:UDP-N-acetyl-D-glucosamine dehydrogenase
VETAITLNRAAPQEVLARLTEGLGGVLEARHVLLLGMGYKPNVADVRDSPAPVLIEPLEAAGAAMGFHDPLVPEIPRTPEHPALAGRRGLDWDGALALPWDAALVVTDHDGVDYAALAACGLPLAVETSNAFARRGIAGPTIVEV